MTDYRNTVFLPATPFPMRGDLPKREPEILAHWQAIDLWARSQAQAAGRPAFVLHDGPIYSNGNLHIGHALNRILKDVVMRAHRMAGFDTGYIPGWDCHGLPIEWKVEEEYRRTGRDKDAVPVLDFRAECRAYSQSWLDIQTAEFQRLGVTGDWAGRYATMDFPAEAAIAGEIGKFLLNGALYRGLRPVMWSTVEKTALAEAEVEYHDHTSDTVWVRFPIVSGPLAGTAAVIWTTTVWTLPGNRALAAGPAIEYAQLRVDSVAEGSLARPGETLLVALERVAEVCAAAGILTHHLLQVMPGTSLEGTLCAHPLRGQPAAQGGYDADRPILLGDFVTTEQGSGLVHMAPGHGEDDFALCRAHGVAVPETVAEDGRYLPGVAMFAGLHVFKAAAPVSAAIEAAGGLLARGRLVHSYPHSWRSKAPLIYRATPQWFIRMDGPEQIRAQALAAIEATAFVPAQGRNRLHAMVAGRPDWCISRQRAWGVPITLFVNRTDRAISLRDPAVVNARIVAAIAAEGVGRLERGARPAEYLGEGRDYRAEDYEQRHRHSSTCGSTAAATHAFVLESGRWPDLMRPAAYQGPLADLYLEGSRSASRLVPARRCWRRCATRGHGAVQGGADAWLRTMDAKPACKMSKSLGNVPSIR